MWWFKLGLYFVAITQVFTEYIHEPLVNTTSGPVIGAIASDGDYYEYLGIPYADSTSGSHRFKAPLPPPTFTEPFRANRRDIKCVRPLGIGFEGTEDCLVVNVFSPMVINTNLPVMVWIKGREFDKVSETDVTFKRLIEKGVVVVSMNFRESVLGFLCLGTETAPGNAGLKDIIAGLKWVQENIAAFGGDPNDITLFGHGSGASAVDLITLSPMAEGLVHKAIAQSGNAFSPWSVTRNNLHNAVQIAEALGHTVENIEDLSDIFTKISVSALMAIINELDITDNSLAFSPCVERSDLESHPFMIKSPYQIIAAGEFLQIPFLTGFVQNEGTIRIEKVTDDLLERMEQSFSDFLQPDLQFESDLEKDALAQRLKKEYFGDIAVSLDTIDDYIAYTGDTMILIPAIRELQMRSEKSTEDVYLYQFSYRGELGDPLAATFGVEGATHRDDLQYLLSNIEIISEDIEIPELDLTVSDILVERWTNFAKTGVPSSETSKIDWQPFNTDSPNYIRMLDANEVTEFNGTLEITPTNPHFEKIEFWNSIYEEHFLDAESSWELEVRDEVEHSGDGEDDNEGSKEDEDNNSGSDSEESNENEDNNPSSDSEESKEEGGSGPGSASTAIAYTFTIISLFTILQKVHSTTLLI